MSDTRPTMITLDLEGVLVPEIWIAVAERTGIDELRRTTRDEPDYDVLMKYRLGLLDEHGLTMSLIEDVIGGLAPMAGAKDFLDELRRRTQVIILSDTFEQFARPLMRQLGWPAILCHRLVVENDRIVDYRLRQADQKRRSVEAFHSLGYRVIAAGDSYNDTSMLIEADCGFLFHAPANVIAEFPQFPALDTYDELAEQHRPTPLTTALANDGYSGQRATSGVPKIGGHSFAVERRELAVGVLVAGHRPGVQHPEVAAGEERAGARIGACRALAVGPAVDDAQALMLVPVVVRTSESLRLGRRLEPVRVPHQARRLP